MKEGRHPPGRWLGTGSRAAAHIIIGIHNETLVTPRGTAYHRHLCERLTGLYRLSESDLLCSEAIGTPVPLRNAA